MSFRGVDKFKSAIRRSLWILIGLALLGIIAVNAFEHLAGNVFQASANVEVPTASLAQIITGTTNPLLDPEVTQDTAQTLAGAPQVYQLAASLTGSRYGTASEIRNATTVSALANTDLLSFTSSASTASGAVGRANAAAGGYVSYDAAQTSSEIRTTIKQLQTTLPTLNATEAASVSASISRLEVLLGASSTSAVLVQPAATATQTSPRTSKDSAIGLAIGLVVALLVIAVREAVDTTVRTEGEVEDILGAPLLASIRTLPRRERIVTIGRFAPSYGDAYLLLASRIANDRRDPGRTVIGVTSALAGEGKTTTIANLAIALARRGQHVLVADFDFHKPVLATLVGVPSGVPGAIEVLDGAVAPEEVLWEVSLANAHPVASRVRGGLPPRTPPPPDGDRAGARRRPGRLLVLPPGRVDNGRPTTVSQQTGTLLRHLGAHADVILLDTPPALLTAEMTELAQVIDSVVVVVRQGQVPQRSLRTLSRQASLWPAELAGAVLTDVPAADSYGPYYGSR